MQTMYLQASRLTINKLSGDVAENHWETKGMKHALQAERDHNLMTTQKLHRVQVNKCVKYSLESTTAPSWEKSPRRKGPPEKSPPLEKRSFLGKGCPSGKKPPSPSPPGANFPLEKIYPPLGEKVVPWRIVSPRRKAPWAKVPPGKKVPPG